MLRTEKAVLTKEVYTEVERVVVCHGLGDIALKCLTLGVLGELGACKLLDGPTTFMATRNCRLGHGEDVAHWPQGCIRREGTLEAAPEAVRQAAGGGCQSGWGRLLSVTNAMEAGTCRPGDSGWSQAGRPGGGGGTSPLSNAILIGPVSNPPCCPS